jgi:hypothetical protein
MMYATLVSSVGKPDLQPRSITRATFALRATAPKASAAIAVAVSLLVCTELGSAAQGPASAWREAPEYVRLFAPAAQRGAYRAYVSPLGLDETLQRFLADSAVLHLPGAWQPQAMIPYDAFGLSGSYNRWKVAGLYRSRRARVARGPRLDHGRLEALTLVAPYPDVTLRRLEPGTLLIVLRVPSETWSDFPDGNQAGSRRDPP